MINEEAMAAAFEARNQEAQVLGVTDTVDRTSVPINSCRLREAIRFVANAPIVGYHVRCRYGDVWRAGGTEHKGWRLRSPMGEIRNGPSSAMTKPASTERPMFCAVAPKQ